MSDSGKCHHQLVAHRAENGYDFVAVCKLCGMRGDREASTPAGALAAFDRNRGARPRQKLSGAALALREKARKEAG